MPERLRDLVTWLLAVLVTAGGTWLRLRGVLALDLQGNEVGYVGAPLADAFSLSGLLYYAPLRPVLTALALAVDPGTVALRAVAWLPGTLVPLAFFALFRRAAGPWVALAGAALLAFDEGQVWGSLVSGIYGLAVLLQVILLASAERATVRGEARAAVAWTVAAVLSLVAHYLLAPLVALSALAGTLAARRHSDPAVRTRWRRAVLVVAVAAAPVVALVGYGLVARFLLTAGGGLEATGAVGFVELWGLDVVPFGLWRPVVNVAVVSAGAVAAVLAWKRAGLAALPWLGFLAVLLGALPFVPRVQAYHALLLHVPLLAFVAAIAAPPPSPPPSRGRVLPAFVAVVCLTLTAGAAGIGLGLVRTEPAGWLIGAEPPYAPLHELAATLNARPDLPATVALYPPGQATALALQRRPTLDLEPCTNRVDLRGVVQEITCPEGTVRPVWESDDRRHLAWDAPPAGAWLAAVERVRVFQLEGRWPERPVWSALDVPPTALGLPPACRPLAADQWLLYACPPSSGN